MGKIDKFLAKSVEVEISGEKYNLKPFTLEEMPLLINLSSKDETIQAKATGDVIKLVMKQIDPSATDEELNSISVEYLTEIMAAVTKVNGMDDPEMARKLLKQKDDKST